LRFYQGIMAGLDAGKIVLAEASTGVGKGRALCAAAIKSAEAKKTPVVISAPTLVVLGQLWEEMSVLRSTDKLGQGLTYGFYPGASEFVDEQKLKDYITQGYVQADQSVIDWVDAGGPMLHKDSPLRAAMSEIGVTPAFLMEDLKQLASNIDVSDLGLRSDSECDTATTLGAIREQTRNADIIFCTDTMLALSHRASWAMVPEPAVLIVDEAHLLEQMFSNIHSDALSMFSLSLRLKDSGKATKVIKALNELTSTLQDNRLGSDGTINLKDIDIGLKTNIKDKAEALLGVLKSKTYKDVERIGDAIKVLSGTVRVLSGQSGDSSYLSFSPDFRYPSISTGKSDLKSIMGSLWKSPQGGAVLASATLYIKNQYGEDKCDYICDNLSVPTSKIYLMEPVVASWVTLNPTLHTPTSEAAKKLVRPKVTDSEDKIELWTENVAKGLANVCENAVGGTLALATSYVQIHGFREQLIKAGISEERIVMQERNKKIDIIRAAFSEKHQAGLRPIWLGLGGAWTGLDLSSKDGADIDTLLTDLVITCCPFGMNRSNTMNARIEQKKLSPIKNESLMMLKQGLGRPVRRENHTNKHIWILDGRLFTDWPGMNDFSKSVNQLFKPYKKRVEFNF